MNISDATVLNSPADIASWPITLTIIGIQETPQGGFTLAFDKPVPDSWKWPSNPAVPSDNFQYTVWMFIQQAGKWFGAGFVQMWQGREQSNGALPPIFALNPQTGAAGYTNWWGDVRKLWPPMSDYIPQPGDQIGILVSAGNARFTSGVTSVRERSNLVMVTLAANDVINTVFTDAPVVVVPTPVPPSEAPHSPSDDEQIAQFAAQAQFYADTTKTLSAMLAAIAALDAKVSTLQKPTAAQSFPSYTGSLLGAKFTLTPSK